MAVASVNVIIARECGCDDDDVMSCPESIGDDAGRNHGGDLCGGDDDVDAQKRQCP